MAEKCPSAIKSAFKTSSVLRTRDLEAHGIWRAKLRNFVGQGVLLRVGRGLYTRVGVEAGENHSLAEVGKRVPRGAVCLLSALRFHELTTESPGAVWIAIESHSRTPQIESLPLKVHYLSGPSFREGIETHTIAGVPVRIYSAAKTVADCFKFRNQIGTKTAIEALKDAWKKKQVTTEDLYRFARVCRVLNVMRPYLEGVLE